MGKTRPHRYEFLATAEVYSEGDSHKRLTAIVENISKNGLRLRTYDPIKIGTKVSIQLTFTIRTGGKARSLLKGRVSRLYRKNDNYFMGIAFDREITLDSNPKLFHYFSKGRIKFILKG